MASERVAATPNAKAESGDKSEFFEAKTRHAAPNSDSADQETPQSLLTLCAALGSDDPIRHDLAFRELIPALITQDAEAAGYLAATWPPGPIRAELLRCVSQEWCKRDPIAAIEWAAGLTDYGERMSTLQDGCVQISQSNPAEAIALATRFNSDDGTLESIAQLWARTDIAAALEWTRRQSPGEQRDRLMARIAFVKAETLPADAAQLVSNEIAPGQAQDEAFMSVLHQWGLVDQAGAADWLARVADRSLRERAINELVGLARRVR